MSSVHLGIDVGGTASRWVACDGKGAVVARGQVNGATAHLFNPVEKERMSRALSAIADALKIEALVPVRVAVGSTGYGGTVFAQMSALLRTCFGVSDGAIVIADDMSLTYAGLFAPGEGHLVSAGTGSIGLHIGDDGQYVRVGGRGILIDDAGSGSWIVLRALDRLYRCLDHAGDYGSMAVLAEEMFAGIGSDDWHGVRAFVYGGDRGAIGALAVAVAKAADRGDAMAAAILADAATELAQLARALIARVGPRPIAFIGGVMTLHSSIETHLRHELAGHEVRVVSCDAALTAARLSLPAQAGWQAVLAAKSALG